LLDLSNHFAIKGSGQGIGSSTDFVSMEVTPKEKKYSMLGMKGEANRYYENASLAVN